MKSDKNYQAQLKKIFQKHSVEFAYLYGSRATGKINKESDFDFAVMLPNNLNSDRRFDVRLRLISEISGVLKTDLIDLIVLNDTRSVFFRFVVIKEGILVFDRNLSERADFELKTMNEYYDYRPFLAAYNEAYIQRQLAN